MGTLPYPEPHPQTLALIGKEPETVEQTRVPVNLLKGLFVKTLYLAGELSLAELGRRMELGPDVVFELFESIRKDKQVEVTGMTGGNHRIVCTSKGQSEAQQIMTRDMYAGPAPVSLETYAEVVRMQSVMSVDVHRSDLEKAFDKLVIGDAMLDQLGAALVSGQSIILYGPTGTGKTAIAETLPRIYKDSVWIPHAVEVQGQIMTVFDKLLHTSRGERMPPDCDARWELCRRPRVMVGGELTMELLDLQFNPSLGYYSAPLQMKANNGILIIDDFGRQRISPAELLNRWIVPMDRRIDFLTLAGGTKFEIPFDLIVAFSTNLNPASLADEAFMRRIQTKIHVTYVSGEQFHEISRRICDKAGMECDATVVNGFIEKLTSLKQPLRACYPRDIIEHIRWKAKYQGTQPLLTMSAIEDACNNYFLAPLDPNENSH